MWRPIEVGDVIAERCLSLTKRGRKKGVTLTIGRPVKGPESNDPWWCPIHVGAPVDRLQAIAGEDSLQCLVLALQYVDAVLPTVAREHGGVIEWFGEHERVVLGGTASNVTRWQAVSNLVAGLADAVAALEEAAPSSKKLSRRLRALVASNGFTETAVHSRWRRER